MPRHPQLSRVVEQVWVQRYGPVGARASVDFLGVPTITVLRFDTRPVRYATVGMSETPMGTDAVVQPGPAARAELVLELSRPVDSVLRRLAALASAPAVEGLVVAPFARVDLGEPLWDGSGFTAVLVGEPIGGVDGAGAAEDRDAGIGAVVGVPGAGAGGVSLLPVVPVGPAELALLRASGVAALREAWAGRNGPDRPGPR